MRLDIMNLFDARYRLRDGSGLGDGLPHGSASRRILGLEQSF